MGPKILGVCYWIATKYGFDLTTVRLIFVLSLIIFGSGLGIYLIIYLLLQLKLIEWYKKKEEPNNSSFYMGVPAEFNNFKISFNQQKHF